MVAGHVGRSNSVVDRIRADSSDFEGPSSEVSRRFLFVVLHVNVRTTTLYIFGGQAYLRDLGTSKPEIGQGFPDSFV